MCELMVHPELFQSGFHCDRENFVLGTPPKAPELKALARNRKVALTIDDNTFPRKVLMVRATSQVETVNGIVPEYVVAAEHSSGAKRGRVGSQLSGTISSTGLLPSRRNGSAS